MKILVLGGYGNFGARICRALAAHPDIVLRIGGRDAARAQSAARAIRGCAEGMVVDASASARDLAHAFRASAIELVIHTAGPFQAQGYRVAFAAAAAGAHYIDLADGRRFVCDFPAALHAAFVAAGRLGVTGASTVPALSSAVVDRLCAGWQRIASIDICIAPAQTAPRGIATLRGVLSYCGEPVEVWSDGRWQTRRGWADPRPVEFERMSSRRGALCDIPDLELFPARYGVARSVMFRAALEVPAAQSVFALLASMRARGLIPQPARLAGILHALSWPLDALGCGLGGMVVRVEGRDESGIGTLRAWHIAADDNHGPEIPCMAAILLARRLAEGQVAMPIGAFACVGLLELSDFEPEFSKWHMVTDTVNDTVEPSASTT